MSILILLVALAVVGVTAVVAVGRGDGLSDPEPDRAPYGTLPPGDVDRAALDRLRFSLGFRGYRMDEVDAVLDRVAAELDAKNERIAELEAHARQKPGAGQSG